MSTPALPPIPDNIASLTAPIILGEIFSSYLFGVLTVQVYVYHMNFPDDLNYIKGFVYTVFLIELASILMSISDMFQWFGSGYGNLIALGNIQLSGVDTPMLGAFVAAAVQMFYCYRIYTINKKARWVSVIVALLALTQIVAGLYGAVVGEQAKTFIAAEGRSKVSVYVLFVGAAVTDVLIVMAMTTLLLFSGSTKIQSSSHGRSNSRIKKVLNLIVETNIASASLALLTLILFAAVPNTNFFTCPSYVLPRIYSNSLLLILNNRYYLTIGAGKEPSSGIFKLSTTRNKSTTDFPSGSGSGGSGGGVGSHFRDRSDTTRIQVDLETATDSLQGGSFSYNKK